jgi:hypothetical protein
VIDFDAVCDEVKENGCVSFERQESGFYCDDASSFLPCLYLYLCLFVVLQVMVISSGLYLVVPHLHLQTQCPNRLPEQTPLVPTVLSLPGHGGSEFEEG